MYGGGGGGEGINSVVLNFTPLNSFNFDETYQAARYAKTIELDEKIIRFTIDFAHVSVFNDEVFKKQSAVEQR